MIDTANLTRIEYTIVGTLLWEPDHVGEVAARLEPEQFASVATRGLYEAITALHLRGAPIDAVTVVQEAGADYETAVLEAAKYAVSPSALAYYCDMLRDSSRLRKIQTEAVAITAASNMDEAGEALDRLNGLMVTRKNVEILSAAAAAQAFVERQRTGLEGKPDYLPWGFAPLNKLLYAELGDFIVVGGYPSAGKTLLSIQFALEMAKKYRVGYFSLETGPYKLTDRIMAHLAKVPLSKIKDRDLSEPDWAALAEAATTMGKIDLHFIRAGGMSVRDIQAVTLNRHYQVIVVDYLQLVEAPPGSRYEQVTGISQGLHTLAQTHGVAVIALAQLSRPEKVQGKPKPPTMSAFRESGQIEQDADIAFLLYPSDPNDNKSRRVLKIGKNKEGERGALELDFDGATQTMTVAEPTPGEKWRATQAAIRKLGKVPSSQVTFTDLDGDKSPLPF